MANKVFKSPLEQSNEIQNDPFQIGRRFSFNVKDPTSRAKKYTIEKPIKNTIYYVDENGTHGIIDRQKFQPSDVIWDDEQNNQRQQNNGWSNEELDEAIEKHDLMNLTPEFRDALLKRLGERLKGK